MIIQQKESVFRTPFPCRTDLRRFQSPSASTHKALLRAISGCRNANVQVRVSVYILHGHGLSFPAFLRVLKYTKRIDPHKANVKFLAYKNGLLVAFWKAYNNVDVDVDEEVFNN